MRKSILEGLDYEPKLEIREEFLPDKYVAVVFDREARVYIVNLGFEDLSRRFFRPTALMNAARVIRERAQAENPNLVLFGRKTLSEGSLRGMERVFLIRGIDEEIDAEIISRLIGYLHLCGGTDSEKKKALLMGAPEIMGKYSADFFLCAMKVAGRVN